MSTGAEHYRESERLLNTIDATEYPSPEQVLRVQVAQVHADLAKAAAIAMRPVALPGGAHLVDGAGLADWYEALGRTDEAETIRQIYDTEE